MAEVTWYVHETTNGAKTSFKDGHVVDLASCKRDIRSVHIIKTAVTKKRRIRTLQSAGPGREFGKFGYVVKQVENATIT